MTDPLASVFSRSAIMRLADPGSFSSGLVDAAQGRVERLAATGGRVAATVRGSRPYAVALWVDGGEPAWSCTCPVGMDGTFCKHCVAVALSRDPDLLERVFDPEDEPDAGIEAGDEAALRAYVLSLDAGRLAELVLEQASSDWRLGERLRAEAATAAGSGPGSEIDLAMWRRRLESAFEADGFVPHRETAGWARDVGGALCGLAELIDVGHAGAVVVLAEHAHRLADAAIQYVDDSDGWLSGISERLVALHLRACVKARPDPVALARRLVELELGSELDTFHRAAARYADVLGDAGLAEYRRLVKPRFDGLADGDERFSTHRFRVTNAMVGVALASKDPDQLIAVKAGDLRAPDDYGEVAGALIEAGRMAEAIEWVERGLAAFGDRSRQTPPLRELLAGLHHAQGHADRAVEVFWAGFESAPSLDAYRRLLREAETAGDAGAWRARALTHLRGRLDGRAQTFAEILLYEGSANEAWQVASEHGCDQRLWLTLARARERAHPEDAIPVYAREADALIGTKKARGYRQAVDLIARIERLYGALGRPEEFASYIARVRAEHGRKSSLMTLLRGKRW
ncbi:MAG: SWIM zinc finger family protein [Egibacteraceae bacterium]